MPSFAEFESAFLAALQEERSNLQGLQGAVEAQLSAWVEHLFREHLGYSWKDFTRGEGAHVGSKGGKQLFPDLRIDIPDTGLIFVECKRPGRLDGPKSQEELDDGVSQLRSYIRAHVDKAGAKPKTVLGVVTDGNRWLLMGLNRVNEFHTIAEWAFLTDDPRLIAQRLWLLAKPALAQPTSPLVEFLARRTLAEVLKENTKLLTRKVNERLPDGAVSQELIGRWLREAFSEPAVPPRLVPADAPAPPGPEPSQPTPAAGPGVTLADLIGAGILTPPLNLFRVYKGKRLEATLLAGGAVEFQSQRYGTCSAAAEAARATVTGRQMHTNGWTFWQYQDAGEKRRMLADARMQLTKSTGKFLGGREEGEAIPKALQTCGPKAPHEQAGRYDLRRKFWEGLLARPQVKATRHANLASTESNWIAAGSGVRGLPFVYVIGQGEARVELYIDRGVGQAEANKRIFDRLHGHRAEIEAAFGGELSCQRLDDKRACRIAYTVTAGGYKSDPAKWPAVQDAMIDAMLRLENALKPHLAKLRMELVCCLSSFDW
jgi:hypothetical protein